MKLEKNDNLLNRFFLFLKQYHLRVSKALKFIRIFHQEIFKCSKKKQIGIKYSIKPNPFLANIVVVYFVLFVFFMSHQQSFSYVGTGLSGLNQYYVRIKVSCSRT